MVVCAYNAYDPSLKINGGHDVFGTHSECFRKGYARGFNQKVADVPRFVQRWSGKYRPHISQKLWHSDDPVPLGYQRAWLNQTMQRGFAIGSIALAKKLQQKASAKKSAISKEADAADPHYEALASDLFHEHMPSGCLLVIAAVAIKSRT